jgi:Tetracyclin repressor-like, C-terminal domain
VREGVEAGLLRDLPPTLVVFGLLGMCNWLHKWYRPDGKRTPAEIADVFVALLERGYLAQPSAGGRDADALARIERRLARLERVLAPPKRPTGPRARRPRAP